MTTMFDADLPCVGIFWVVDTRPGTPRLLAAGCKLADAEPYGDCLTYGDGHYETWGRWRKDRILDPALRAVIRSSEYEDWPRGRIVFLSAENRFTLYADRKLMAAEAIARICNHFCLPADRTSIEGDFHYQSTETPGALR
jgi:hypothetical protein